MNIILTDKTPHKKLVQSSIEFLDLVNSEEYRELQDKFDSLYSQIKKEQNMLLIIQDELTGTQKFKKTEKAIIIEKTKTINYQIAKLEYVFCNFPRDFTSNNFQIDKVQYRINP